MTYIYKYEIGNDQVKLTLATDKGIGFWKLLQPTFTEDHAGDLVPDPTLVDTGVMKDFTDIDGLKKYLLEQKVLREDDEIKMRVPSDWSTNIK